MIGGSKAPGWWNEVLQQGWDKILSEMRLEMNKHHNYSSAKSIEDHKDEFESMNNEEKSRAIMNPGHVDEGLWDKAKSASVDAFGKIKYPFVMYLYKKWGGK